VGEDTDVVGKKSLERHRLRWQDDIKMYPKEVGWEVVDWIHLAQDSKLRRAVMTAGMNIKVSTVGLRACALVKQGMVVCSAIEFDVQ
jgi:hypothetical protein